MMYSLILCHLLWARPSSMLIAEKSHHRVSKALSLSYASGSQPYHPISMIIAHLQGSDHELDLGAIIQNWTLGGYKSLFCEKFFNTVVCYRKPCRLGMDHDTPGPPDPSLFTLHDTTIQSSQVFPYFVIVGYFPQDVRTFCRFELSD